ncbi:LTA synthase family protein [Flavicella sediminum]|uniref:LTA synthase family protein n=1 Tax=Flavicella sediminum TaxID=2585141 RepID=UPI0011218E9D|nr:LTA synthase family protein [Flavicella sediminum]
MLKKIPSYIKYLFTQILLVFLYISVHRALFYHFFADLSKASEKDITQAIAYGIRFDIKLAMITMFPLAILIFIFNTKFFIKKIFKKISIAYLTTSYLVLTLFYLFDFGYYEYLSTRLDATSLRFFNDLKISTQVLIESYPIFKGLFLLLIFLTFIGFVSKKIYEFYANNSLIVSKKRKAFFVIVPFFLMAFGIYNSFSHYPLRWSQAFFSKDNQINQFTLNPVLYFFDSFAFRSTGFDLEATKSYYPVIADYLNLPKDSISFERKVVFKEKHDKQPNIIVVMMESVGAAPMSFYGNPIQSTPKMDSIVKKSIHFTNFFVHKAGTAGSVFASITGLPDVDMVKTASRNPMVIDQRIIFDQFKGYEKLYFLGGSANWANIRGLFQSNIKDLKIFEEGSYETENRADVWGIDDYELFKEADKELVKLHQQDKPFITYIQTATNHMPFTVPDEKESYKPLQEDEISADLLKKSGFKSVAQLNALRYLDFNIDIFLKRAKKSGYYDNSIFFFFGDHNTAMNEFDFMKRKEFTLGLSMHHVPFFIHAPKFVKAKEINTHANLIDLYPTAAGLAKIDYTNYTLGVDLLDSTRTKKASFIYMKQGEPGIELLKDGYAYTRTIHTKKTALYDLSKDKLINIEATEPETAKKMDSLLQAFYHSTNYLYYNNKK